MKQIELNTNPGLWIAFFMFFFVLSSLSLIYISDVNELSVILGIAFLASAIMITTLIAIYNSYSQKVTLTDTEIRIFGVPSATVSYNEIQKIRVNIGGFRIYGKSQNPILISTMSSNFSEAKNLLIRKIRNEQHVTFEGSDQLIHKYFIK